MFFDTELSFFLKFQSLYFGCIAHYHLIGAHKDSIILINLKFTLGQNLILI